jgi:hypothetical protein
MFLAVSVVVSVRCCGLCPLLMIELYMYVIVSVVLYVRFVSVVVYVHHCFCSSLCLLLCRYCDKWFVIVSVVCYVRYCNCSGVCPLL